MSMRGSCDRTNLVHRLTRATQIHVLLRYARPLARRVPFAPLTARPAAAPRIHIPTPQPTTLGACLSPPREFVTGLDGL